MTTEQSNTQEGVSQEQSNTDITALFQGFRDAILEQVDSKLSSVGKPAETQSESTTPTTLTQRIAQLEKQLAEKAEAEHKAARQQSYDNSLKAELSRYELAFPNETSDIIAGMMSKVVDEVEGKWLAKDGKSLQEHVDGFFATPFGQHLLKAPTGQVGTGTQRTQQPRTAPTTDANSAIASLFGFKK